MRHFISGLGLGLGLETSGLGLGLGLETSGLGLGLGLGLETPGLVNIPGYSPDFNTDPVLPSIHHALRN